MTISKTAHTPKVNPQILSLRQSPIREITKKLEQAGKDPGIISFGGGQPSFPPPAFVMGTASSYLKQPRSHRYSSTPGIPELRGALAQMMVREEGWSNIDPDNILVTQSATNGIETAFSTLTREGDELIVIAPLYPGFVGALQTHGVRMNLVETRLEDEFRLDVSLLNERITRGKTKAVVVVTPDNPTGRILSPREVRAIGELAQDNGLAIISDESYYRIVYGGEFTPFSEYLPNLIGLRSFSKTASATGWRIGYNYSSRELTDAMERVNQFRVLCVAPFFQQLVFEFVMNHTEREDYLRKVLDSYRTRRDAMGASLKKWLPYSRFVTPQSGFYFFLRLPGVPDDVKFSQQVFDQTKVAIVPGSAFGMGRDMGYFRFTFVTEEPGKIDEGIQRISRYIEETTEKPRILGEY